MAAKIENMEDAAVLYRKVEARVEAKKAEYEAAVAKDKKAMEQIELIMMQLLKAAGVRSMNLPGVAEVKIVDKRTFGFADPDTFLTFVVQNNKPELLHRRIHDANMQAFIDDKQFGGFIPPGINVFTVAQVKILKGK